jgi:hypothetical protein
MPRFPTSFARFGDRHPDPADLARDAMRDAVNRGMAVHYSYAPVGH